MIKNCMLTAFVVAVLTISVSVYADVLDSVNENTDTQVITVSGNLGQVKAGEIITVSVGKSLDAEHLSYFEFVTLDSNGMYSHIFKLPDYADSGLYEVQVSGKYISEPSRKQFAYFSGTKVNEVIGSLQNIDGASSGAAEKAKTIIDANIELFFGNKAQVYRDALKNKADLKPFYTKILSIGNSQKLSDYSNGAVSELIVASANFAVSAEDLKTLTESFHTAMGVDENKLFKSIVSAEFEKVYVMFFKMKSECEEFKIPSKVGEALCKSILLAKIKYAPYWADVHSLMLEYNDDYLSANFTKYNKLKNKYAVDSALMGNSAQYCTAEQLVSQFNSKVDSVYNSENSSGGSGDGGFASQPSKKTVTEIDYTPIPTTNSKFNDLSGVEWAQEHIYSLADKGIINGVGEGAFAPNEYVTREQFVKIVIMSFGSDKSSDAFSFSDVSKSEWYYTYIARAIGQGLINGRSESQFGVGEYITRQDIATIVYRAVKEKISGSEEDAKKFEDASEISDYAAQAIAVLSSCGIINGTDGNRFEPNAYASRAQAAVIIDKMLTLLNDGGVGK